MDKRFSVSVVTFITFCVVAGTGVTNRKDRRGYLLKPSSPAHFTAHADSGGQPNAPVNAVNAGDVAFKENPGVKSFKGESNSPAKPPKSFRRVMRDHTPLPDEAVISPDARVKVFSTENTDDPASDAGSRERLYKIIELAPRLRDATPQDARTLSSNARVMHNVEEFYAEFPDITGQTITAAVFDEGAILQTHVEFKDSTGKSRVVVRSKGQRNKHATHVAGTMAAKGNNKKAKGMAVNVKLISEDFGRDLKNLGEISKAINISNHSYGPIAGWDQNNKSGDWYWFGDTRFSKEEDARFGKYTADEVAMDDILFYQPGLLSFIAAGNDRADAPPQQPLTHKIKSGSTDDNGMIIWEDSNDVRKADGFDRDGLDTVVGLCLSKNTICVGSISPTEIFNSLAGEDYSAWGPADDGRIKPDIVANGHVLFSASAVDDEAYYEDSGTSMASPVAAGIGALLMELLQKTRPELMSYSAAVIKAVLIHTATDDVEIAGPDPRFGWGSINAIKAGWTIARKVEGKFRNFIDVAELGTDESTKSKGYEFEATGDPIRVTLVWIDPPGPPSPRELDNASPALQNDLDVKLTDPNGQVFYPYRLDRANPLSQAKRDGPNRVDNVEVIDAGSVPGKWKIEVTATSIRINPSQRFAIVVEGLR